MEGKQHIYCTIFLISWYNCLLVHWYNTYIQHTYVRSKEISSPGTFFSKNSFWSVRIEKNDVQFVEPIGRCLPHSGFNSNTVYRHL